MFRPRAEFLGKAEGKKAAERLAHLVDALHKNGAIGEYSVMAKFTEGFGGRVQAHHILEEQFARKFNLGNPGKVPSVILTEAEHKTLTAQLRVATADANTPQKLWKAYQKVYEKNPLWLQAIESYFVKGK